MLSSPQVDTTAANLSPSTWWLNTISSPYVTQGAAGVNADGGLSFTAEEYNLGITGELLSTADEKNSDFVKVLFVGGLLSMFIVFAVAGNVLVIVAILTDRHLRKTSNYFLVSLALADALVASLVMTFAVVNDVMEAWPFGPVFCSVWQSADVMCSSASILHLSAVSLDRYINIRQPLHYDRLVTQRRSLLVIVFIWSMSALLSFLPIHLGWHQDNSSDNSVDRKDPELWTIPNKTSLSITSDNEANSTIVSCRDRNGTAVICRLVTVSRTVVVSTGCQLELNMWYAIVSSVVSFYAPCVVMIGIYWKLYRYAVKQAKRINETQAGSTGSVRCTRSTDSLTVKSLLNTIHRDDSQRSWHTAIKETGDTSGNKWRSSSAVSYGRKSHDKSRHLTKSTEMVSVVDLENCQNFEINLSTGGTEGICGGEDKSVISHFLFRQLTERRRHFSLEIMLRKDAQRTGSSGELVTPWSSPTSRDVTGRPSVTYVRRQSDHKAAVTLGIIMGVFLVCWMPFFTMNVVSAFYQDIPKTMFSVFTWLGYMNSGMNPVIYGVFNQEFRRAFKHVLTSCYQRCCCVDPHRKYFSNSNMSNPSLDRSGSARGVAALPLPTRSMRNEECGSSNGKCSSKFRSNELNSNV